MSDETSAYTKQTSERDGEDQTEKSQPDAQTEVHVEKDQDLIEGTESTGSYGDDTLDQLAIVDASFQQQNTLESIAKGGACSEDSYEISVSYISSSAESQEDVENGCGTESQQDEAADGVGGVVPQKDSAATGVRRRLSEENTASVSYDDGGFGMEFHQYVADGGNRGLEFRQEGTTTGLRGRLSQGGLASIPREPYEDDDFGMESKQDDADVGGRGTESEQDDVSRRYSLEREPSISDVDSMSISFVERALNFSVHSGGSQETAIPSDALYEDFPINGFANNRAANEQPSQVRERNNEDSRQDLCRRSYQCFISIRDYSKVYSRRIRTSKDFMIFKLFLFVLPISAFCMGVINYNSCPWNEMFPVIVLLCGLNGMFLLGSNLALDLNRTLCPSAEQLCFLSIRFSVGFALFVLYICVLYYIHQKSPSFDPTHEDYCDMEFYHYAYYANLLVIPIAVVSCLIYLPTHNEHYYLPLPR